MTNVTRKLPSAKLADLNTQMAQLFSNETKSNCGVLTSLLTEAEQIMLVKRVAAVLMLEVDYSSYRVAKTLQLSHSTVRRYQTALVDGEYNVLLGRTKHKKFDSEKFWSVVGKLLRVGLPPMVGPGRTGRAYSVNPKSVRNIKF